MGEHTVEFQRDGRAAPRCRPAPGLHQQYADSPRASTRCRVRSRADGADTAPPDRRFDGAVVGLESRFCALAADDPLARRRQLRLAHLAGRRLAVDPRTGTTTPDLWPPGSLLAVEEVHDVDDWLAVIATGRCVGVTSTLTQYRRQGAVFRRLRDAPPAPVRLVCGGTTPHPATADALGLLAELGRGRNAADVAQPVASRTRSTLCGDARSSARSASIPAHRLRWSFRASSRSSQSRDSAARNCCATCIGAERSR